MTTIFYIFLLLILIVDIKKISEDCNLFSGLYRFLSKRIKHKRLMVAILSSIFGVLPVHGRNILSAPILRSFFLYDEKAKNKMGVVSYLTTHHYYLWSPIEKTMVIPMLALSISYLQMLKYTLPLLVFMLAYTFIFVFFVLKEDEIEFEEKEEVPKTEVKKFQFKKILKYINWKLILFLVVVLTASWLLKKYSDQITEFVKGVNILPLALLVAFLFSFVLGSSAKFAGIVVVLVSMFGIQYITLFIAVEFAGYLVSPTHKCIVITNEYFKTNYLYFYKVIGLCAIGLVLIGLLTLI